MYDTEACVPWWGMPRTAEGPSGPAIAGVGIPVDDFKHVEIDTNDRHFQCFNRKGLCILLRTPTLLE